MTYSRERVEARRQMPLEKRVEMLEAALDSLAPAIHDLYECLRKVQTILASDRLDMHLRIEKTLKSTLDRYDKEWNFTDWDEL